MCSSSVEESQARGSRATWRCAASAPRSWTRVTSAAGHRRAPRDSSTAVSATSSSTTSGSCSRRATSGTCCWGSRPTWCVPCRSCCPYIAGLASPAGSCGRACGCTTCSRPSATCTPTAGCGARRHCGWSPRCARGLLSIAGGKLTTYRVMGRDVADRVAARLRALDGRPHPPRPRTDRLPLPGGETADLEVLVKAAAGRVAEATARHLVGRYGSEAAALLNLVERDRGLGEPIAAGRPEIWAEVAHAVEREMAVRLSDVLVRRLHLFSAARDQGVPATSAVADRLGALLGWDASRRAAEIADYLKLVERSRAFAKEVARVRKR